MDRRDFLRVSSLATLSAIGTWTGLSNVLPQTAPTTENRTPGQSNTSQDMEHRKLGKLDVSAIGLGCLPMVGYYGGKYEKKEMIALTLSGLTLFKSGMISCLTKFLVYFICPLVSS